MIQELFLALILLCLLIFQYFFRRHFDLDGFWSLLFKLILFCQLLFRLKMSSKITFHFQFLFNFHVLIGKQYRWEGLCVILSLGLVGYSKHDHLFHYAEQLLKLHYSFINFTFCFYRRYYFKRNAFRQWSQQVFLFRLVEVQSFILAYSVIFFCLNVPEKNSKNLKYLDFSSS